MRRIFTLLRYKVKYVTSSSKKWKWKRLEGLNTLEKNCFSLRTTTQTQWTTNQSTILKKHPKDQRISHKVIQNSMFILSITANMAHRHSHIQQVRWPQVTQFIPQYMLHGISQLLPVFHHFQQNVLSVATSIYNFTPSKDYSPSQTLASQYHFRILHCSSFSGTQRCPLFVWAVPLPGKVQKSYRSGNNFAYNFWSPQFNMDV